ncbi:MAG: hypothetical protein HZA35_01285 [Parcubacteria group bacterium]|nr:hypothetical protein [Parcubacteria group bacterium]
MLSLFTHKRKLPRLGVVGDSLPLNYIHPLQIRSYLESEYNERAQIQIVGEEGCLGRTWNHGPLHFELYVSDKEPIVTPIPYFRIILWQPLTKLEIPTTWRHLWFSTEISRQIGFAHIKNSSYWTTWTKNAQRDRTIWLNNKEFEVITSDYATFLKEYPNEGVYTSIRQTILTILKNKIERFGTSIHFFAARHKVNKEINAMVALIEFPNLHKAFYLSAFVKPGAKQSLYSTGLIDHCFQFCISHSIEFFDFGSFWAPGSPSNWKGFSRFKQKFGVTLLRYPPILWKTVKNNQKEVLALNIN